MRRPDLFIIGAPRCGTSSLYRYLQSHPDIFMSTPKEPQFFAADTVARAGMRYPEDMDRYLQLFAHAGQVRRIGEASTVYLESRPAADRIHAFQQQPRLVVMLRDPVEMIQSLHEMRVRQGLEPRSRLDEALAEERHRAGFGAVGDQSSVRYRDRARYGEMLPVWLDRFGPEAIHVVVTEDLGSDPEAVLRRLLEFLEVDAGHSSAFVRRNRGGRGVRSVRLARALARAPRRTVNSAPLDAVTMPLLRLMRRLNQVRRARPPLSATLRRQLREEFREDVDRTSALLGRNLAATWWPDE